MILNDSNMRELFRGYKTLFNKGLAETPSHWAKIAMKVPSSTSEETYAWLDDIPSIREWIGDRIIHDLSASSYRVKNKTFEDTISVKRTDIEDDQYGLLSPKVEMMGSMVARHPDKLVFQLLRSGFDTACFDGQFFFDADHPVGRGEQVTSVSNMQAGSATPWYLMDCSQPLKPLIYQERVPFDFTSLTDPGDEMAFTKDRYFYGVRGRSNVGFGLWQLAFGSKAELTPATYGDLRSAMMGQKGDNGEPIGIIPSHLVVPPALERAARTVLNAALVDGGNTNVWAGSAELIVSPYLA